MNEQLLAAVAYAYRPHRVYTGNPVAKHCHDKKQWNYEILAFIKGRVDAGHPNPVHAGYSESPDPWWRWKLCALCTFPYLEASVLM